MSKPDEALQQELFVPDRFESLREHGGVKLGAIVTPVTPALGRVDERFMEMRASARGALMVLKGDSGSGKSTFLDTVHLFRAQVETHRIPFGESIGEAMRQLGPTGSPRIVVLEGREALGTVSDKAIEEGLHAVNAFVRSSAGRQTLVVWPVNTDAIASQLAATATALGGEALLGQGEPIEHFPGPDPAEFVHIAERTVAALNEGASLAALGISEDRAGELQAGVRTIGAFLGRIRTELLANGERVRGLIAAERCRLWTVVIAGNEPEGDVAALTRGGYAYADIDRLLTATGANVVADLKQFPEKLGILGTVLDSRIVHLDMVAALAMCRSFGDSSLHNLMQGRGMTTKADASAADRIFNSELGLLLQGSSLGTRKRGPKPGSNTAAAFQNVADIAKTNDTACNRALGKGLLTTGLISGFETERDLGTGLNRRTDLYCESEEQPIRIEVMWRTKAGRADIANYVFSKLANYGKAIGFLTGWPDRGHARTCAPNDFPRIAGWHAERHVRESARYGRSDPMAELPHAASGCRYSLFLIVRGGSGASSDRHPGPDEAVIPIGARLPKFPDRGYALECHRNLESTHRPAAPVRERLVIPVDATASMLLAIRHSAFGRRTSTRLRTRRTCHGFDRGRDATASTSMSSFVTAFMS